MRHTIKCFWSVVLCFALLLPAGCKSSNDVVITYETSGSVKCLDPQLAQNETELLLVRNMFEGLMRYDENGELAPAVATDFTRSSDNCTYTFMLSPDAKWSNGDSVTANDFVFAFRRAVDPNTAAPMAHLLTSIQNARQILSGAQTSEMLGVKAKDQHTLEIQLENPNIDFLSVLTNAVCMPCNEEFFNETQGKYGLDRESILSNGSFSLKRWPENDTVSFRLARSSTYCGKFTAGPAAALVYVGDVSTRFSRIASGALDGGQISYEDVLAAHQKGVTTFSFYDTTYVLAVNRSACENADLFAQAFFNAVHYNAYASALPNQVIRACGVVPSAAKAFGSQIRDNVAQPQGLQYQPEHARSIYLDAANAVKNNPFENAILLYPEGDLLSAVASTVASHWQQALGVHVNISSVSSTTALANVMTSGAYALAIYPAALSDGSVLSFLKQFQSDAPANVFGYRNETYDQLIKTLESTTDETFFWQNVKKAESLLLQSMAVLPLISTPSVYAVASGVTGARFQTGMGLDFAYTQK